jgi:hypothetical protein
MALSDPSRPLCSAGALAVAGDDHRADHSEDEPNDRKTSPEDPPYLFLYPVIQLGTGGRRFTSDCPIAHLLSNEPP